MSRSFGKVEDKNIGTLKTKIEHMLQKHGGIVRLQMWSSDPDNLWSAMPYEKSFHITADGSEVGMGSAKSMIETAWSSDVDFSINSGNNAKALVATNLRHFSVYTPNRPRLAFDEAYCFVVFNQTGLVIERKEFAPPYEGKRNAPQAFWSVLELTLLD